MRLATRQRFGLKGELWALDQLLALGYQAQLVSGFFASIDIMLESLLPVEVKIAQITMRRVRAGFYRPCWEFNLANCLPPERDWILIAIAMDGTGALWPYVIYSGQLKGRASKLRLTSHPEEYSGWASGALFNWRLIGEALRVKRAQAGQLMLPLWAEVN